MHEQKTQGKLKEGTGWAEFKLQYDAIVFRPFKGEVLECVVREVNKFGFFAECGPQQVFVSELVSAPVPLVWLCVCQSAEWRHLNQGGR